MKKTTLTFIALVISTLALSQDKDAQFEIDSIEQSLIYETGIIELESGNATITVPKGFRYLDKKQSIYVLSDLWENPTDNSILGMLVPENRGVLEPNSWVFTISFEEMGYVKDDDADDIDYNDLLKEQQKEFKESNPERIKQGYDPIEFIGWASSPYYDKSNKILHWAKELKFGDDNLHTLNYNLRVLGRKGVFMLNAVASMKELPEVQSNIDNVIQSVEFKDGHKYSDFLPEVDNVAAWTIGGLVAGKLLAKAGFFVIILKFWKIIALVVVGFFIPIRNKFRKKKIENTDRNTKELTK